MNLLNLLCRFVNWILFLVRNKGQRPAYPFADDGIEKPLQLRIGSWGSTKWYDPSDGTISFTKTIEGAASIAESMERDIYGCTHQEVVEANTKRREAIKDPGKFPPRVIGFSAECRTDTG